ncbi:MAG: AMP-binding protein, partial [Burkholderiales bacterium]
GFYVIPHVLRAAGHCVPESGTFDPAGIAGLAKAFDSVSLFAAPTMVSRLIECPQWTAANVQNVKTLVYGGGPMYSATLRAAISKLGFRLVQIYGQGESPMTITRLDKLEHQRAAQAQDDAVLASAGSAFAAVEFRIADQNNEPLPAGVAGEVLVRGDVVMQGYWG